MGINPIFDLGVFMGEQNPNGCRTSIPSQAGELCTKFTAGKLATFSIRLLDLHRMQEHPFGKNAEEVVERNTPTRHYSVLGHSMRPDACAILKDGGV